MEHLDMRRKITIMIAIMAAMLFAALNQTIVGTALPRIISDLGGLDYYTWVFTIYMLTSSITMILVGKLSDIYGRKPFILIGIAIFTTGSFLSGLSGNIFELIIFRGIQGFGAGMIMSTAYAAIGDLFVPRERGRWQGLMSANFGLASVFGPALGGYIVDHAPWHWVFWIFLPFGFVAIALIWKLFPSIESNKTKTIDYAGSIFLTLTIVPLLLAFSWAGTTYAWASAQILGMFIASVAAFTLFILIERKASNPVLPLFLFKNSIFTVANVVGFIMGAGMFGAIMYMPFFVQGVMGTSATLSGFVTMPMTLSLVIGSTVCGTLMTRTGKYKLFLMFGMLIMTAGMISMYFMDVDTTVIFAILNMMMVGLGLGFGIPILTLSVQNAVDQKLLGVATASTQLFRSLGGTMGVSVMGTVMIARMGSKIADLSGQSGGVNLSSLSPDIGKKLSALEDPQVLLDPNKLQAIQNSLPTGMHDMFIKLLGMMRDALDYSLTGVFLTGGCIVFCAFIFSCFLKEIPLRSAAIKGKDISGKKGAVKNPMAAGQSS